MRALAVALVVMWVTGSLAGCTKRDDGDKPQPPPQPKTAALSRVNPVCAADVECDDDESFWVGPDQTTVHAVLKSAPDCPASLILRDKKTNKETNAATAPAGQVKNVALKVPASSILVCGCAGDGDAHCSCTITGADPPLPPNTVLGPVTPIAPGAPVTDPAKGTAVPPGTPLVLSCGKSFDLWSGPESYVTVAFQGSKDCRAKVTPERTGHATAGGEEITDRRPFARTFGPVTKLTASCEGKGAGQSCRFTVTETIALP
jgi:hypothetical protein